MSSGTDSPRTAFLQQHSDLTEEPSSLPGYSVASGYYSSRGSSRYGSAQRRMHPTQTHRSDFEDEEEEFRLSTEEDSQFLSRGQRMSVRSVYVAPTSYSHSHSHSHSYSHAPLSHPKATSAITTLEEEKASMVKHRLQACGLEEHRIDQAMPHVDKDAIGSVWSHHDRGKLGHLTAAEARCVAVWLYGRIPVLFRGMVMESAGNAGLSRAQSSALVCEHLPHLLPGTSEEIADYFISTLKLNEQGRVAQDEFVRCWNRHARVICPSAQQKNLPPGAAYCVIL